ncbi:uncharacterized protein LOC143602318 [Bidens hawaiensis]|uniref:uncharacterized protein LOC143602318 n=1 Tax=Bidens hawaiensis TaxID=980011 RepID=UPI004049FC33
MEWYKALQWPLTFLAALYAHELQLKRSPKNATAPTIHNITTSFLANLEVSMYDEVQEDNQLTQNVEDQLMLVTHMESAESQTDEGQTAIDLNVNLLQDEEDEVQFQSTNPDSVMNLKLFIGPPCAQSLSGSSTNLIHCNRLEPPRDKNVSHEHYLIL